MHLVPSHRFESLTLTRYQQAEGSTGQVSDVLRPGKEMVAAGYCMYGASCNLVISLGEGVNGYTLDNVRLLSSHSMDHTDPFLPLTGNWRVHLDPPEHPHSFPRKDLLLQRGKCSLLPRVRLTPSGCACTRD